MFSFLLNVVKYRVTYLLIIASMTSINLLAFLQSNLLEVQRSLSGYVIPTLIGAIIGLLFSANRVRLLEKGNEQRRLLLNIVQALSVALDERDAYTYGHSSRVTDYALELGGRAGLNESELKILEVGSILHDIGKIGISDSILNKPGKLTDEEIELIKQHPVKGERILGQSKDLKDILFVCCVRSHHEHYDGTGYPDGLAGEKIPVMARIIAISDAFDAMTSLRPYRQKMSTKEALIELKRCSGTQFDPKLVSIFCKIIAGDQFEQASVGNRPMRLQVISG